MVHVVLADRQDGDTLPGELPTDEMIARRACHVLTCALLSDQVTADTLKLAKHFAPADADLKAWLKEKFGPKPSDTHLQQYAGMPRPTIHSPARDYLARNAPDTTRITVQRSTRETSSRPRSRPRGQATSAGAI